MTKHDDDDLMSDEEAMAMLERCKDQIMLESQLKPQDAADLEAALEGEVMLCGPQTELAYRRMLRDIKESGNGD